MGQTPGCRLYEPQEEESQEVAAGARPEPGGATAATTGGAGADHADTCRGSASTGASNAAEGRRRVGPDHAAACRDTNNSAGRRAVNGESDAAGAKHAAAALPAHDGDADGVAAAAAVASAIAAAPGYVALGAAPRSA